jgi:hypothetical protein
MPDEATLVGVTGAASYQLSAIGYPKFGRPALRAGSTA